MALEAAAAAKAAKSKSQPNSKANTASSGVSDASTLKLARWLSDGTGHVAPVESTSQRDPMANVLAPPSAPARVTDPTTLKVARWLTEGAGPIAPVHAAPATSTTGAGRVSDATTLKLAHQLSAGAEAAPEGAEPAPEGAEPASAAAAPTLATDEALPLLRRLDTEEVLWLPLMRRLDTDEALPLMRRLDAENHTLMSQLVETWGAEDAKLERLAAERAAAEKAETERLAAEMGSFEVGAGALPDGDESDEEVYTEMRKRSQLISLQQQPVNMLSLQEYMRYGESAMLRDARARRDMALAEERVVNIEYYRDLLNSSPSKSSPSPEHDSGAPSTGSTLPTDRLPSQLLKRTPSKITPPALQIPTALPSPGTAGMDFIDTARLLFKRANEAISSVMVGDHLHASTPVADTVEKRLVF